MLELSGRNCGSRFTGEGSKCPVVPRSETQASQLLDRMGCLSSFLILIRELVPAIVCYNHFLSSKKRKKEKEIRKEGEEYTSEIVCGLQSQKYCYVPTPLQKSAHARGV